MNKDIINHIKNNFLFKDVNTEELDFSEISGELITKKGGEYILKSGTAADKFYLIIYGKILSNVNGKKQLYTDNYFIGGECAKGEENYSVTAVASDDSLLLALNSDEIKRLVAQNEMLITNIENEFSAIIEDDSEQETEEISETEEMPAIDDFPEKEDEKVIVETKFDAVKASKIIADIFESTAQFSNGIIEDVIIEIEDEKAKEKLIAANERIKLMKKAADNSRLFSELKENYEVDKYNISDLLNDLVNNLSEKVSCELKVNSNDDFNVEVDFNSFLKAIEQILINSCEATEQNGEISFAVKRDADLAEILIADNGAGFPEEIFQEVFEPYFSYKKDNYAGLGLAIADKIIRAQQGKIAVKNSSESGTVISITLSVVD